jgi:predicted short-subunit dehydrogenase-like oxidoreductase (DUF2520 family)
MTSVRIVGPGRAGTSLALALTNAGWYVAPMLGRSDDLSAAAKGIDLLIIATPDTAVTAVADEIEPVAGTVVSHLSGSLSLSVLGRHERQAALHPLVALPTPEVGARRLIGAWFAVTGDPLIRRVVEALYGRAFTVEDDDRAAYHAAASIAANHLVALMGQVQRVGATVGVPFEAYLDLARAALDDVAALGPVAALTGPVSRGDEATVRRHLEALPSAERKAYRAMADAARTLVQERRRMEERPPDPDPLDADRPGPDSPDAAGLDPDDGPDGPRRGGNSS